MSFFKKAVLEVTGIAEKRRIAEAEAKAKREKEEQEAAERAFWASPEGQKVRAEQMLAQLRIEEERERAKIRHTERTQAEETARRMAEEEHKRQQETLKNLNNM